jgi:hypothetical protein
LTGFALGMIPNKVSIKINGKKTFSNLNLSLVGGCAGVLGFASIPFLLIHYFSNNTYFDKLYDKYDIDIKRYYQFDGNNDKYAFPSLIKIEINNKNNL